MKVTKENLYNLYKEKNLPISEISKILGISQSEIYRCLSKFKIPTRKTPDRQWENEEINFIRENYKKFGTKYCSEYLNATIKQICYIVSVYGLSHIKEWSKEEIEFLKQNYEKLGATICGEQLKRDIRSTGNKANQLGLKKFFPQAKDGHQFCSKCKIEKPFEEFGKNNRTKRGIVGYCKVCFPKIRQKRREENPFLNWAWKTHSAHKQKFNVNFTVNDIEKLAQETKECNFCSRELCFLNKGIKDNSPSLDRLDNNNDLYLNNIIILCQKCNATKSNRSVSDFIDYIENILPKIKEIKANR